MNDIELYAKHKKDFILKNFSDSLVSHIPQITQTIRDAGVLTRYFAHYVSRPNNVYEVDESLYKRLVENPFFNVVKIRWYIKGPQQSQTKMVLNKMVDYVGVEESNKISVKEVLLTMPTLGGYIHDYLEFWQEE